MTRGRRNNNPFNIIHTVQSWKGKKPDVERTDSKFEQFYDIDYGVRAGIVLIKNYLKKGYDTPRKIITRFAPLAENNLDDYLFFVSGYVDLDCPIVWRSNEFYALLSAICNYESEVKYNAQNFEYIIKLFRLTFN